MKNPEADQPYPDDWDDLFRQRFAEFQSEPPANALARILERLPRASSAFDRRKPWLLGGLALLLLVGGSWFISQYSSLVSTRLPTRPMEASQPNKVSAEQAKTTTTTSKAQLSREGSKPLATEALPEAVVPNKQSVASSDGKVATEAGDKTVINSDNRTGVDLRSKLEVPSHKPQELVSATSKASSPTADRENVITENTVTAEAGTNRLKAIIKRSRTATKTTESAEIRYSTESDNPLLTNKNRLTEGNKLARAQSKASTNTSQEGTNLATSPANLTNKPIPEMDKSSEVVQQTGVSPALPQTGPQQSDQQSLLPIQQAISLASLTNRPLQSIRLRLTLPDITLPSLPQSAPQQPAISRRRPVVFIGVMPLYTYQQIAPIATDDVWVKNVRSQRALSSHRAGVRVQADVEWPLSQRVSVRTSLIYNRLNQQVNYTTPSEKPDSIRVERVDDKTVRLTPYYSDKQVTRQSNWHYVGIGSDLVWQVGKLGAWRHYASAGVSVGTYLAQGAGETSGPLSGFVQASYGIERPLTPSVWFRIAPTVQYGLSTMSDSDGLFHVRPYTYGLTIGLRK